MYKWNALWLQSTARALLLANVYQLSIPIVVINLEFGPICQQTQTMYNIYFVPL